MLGTILILLALVFVAFQNWRLLKLMATQGQGLTDLQTQVAALLNAISGISTVIGTVITDLNALIAQLANPPAGDSDAAVEAASQQVSAAVASLTALNANLTSAVAAVPAAPVPPATPAVKKV